jgi:dipeptidyl aminopeptidase/acylaminoacyl peptidase
MPTQGGEVRVLVEARGDFSAPEWDPTGCTLACALRRADALPEGEKAPLSIRVTRLYYKEDGKGYMPTDRFHIYRVDTQAAAPELIAVTDPRGDWNDTEPVWSPDGARLAFLSNRRAERARDVENTDLYVVAAEGGEPVQCTHRRGWMFAPAWAPDGTWLALLGCTAPPGHALFRKNMELYRVAADGRGEETSLTAGLDRCTMNLCIDDLWGLDYWMQPPALAADGRTVYVAVSDQGGCHLAAVRVDTAGQPTGTIDRLFDDRVLVAFDVAPAAGRAAIITSTFTEPGPVEICDLEGGERRRVGFPLQPYCEEADLRAPHELRVTTTDGNEVHGWLHVPAGAGPFPLLLSIHGGPVVQYGRGFVHELATYAACGYAVLYVNPRGSQGYGADFAGAIHLDWGTRPFTDLMAAVDHVLARYPIDPDRLGVLGGSYGGYMTNWIVSHTNRFKAACTERTVSSMAAMLWCDSGWGIVDDMEGPPWEEPERYRRMSPITYAQSIETPMLILQGLGDMRTPPDQGERLYMTLRLLGKPVEMVLFPGANHDLSRNGPPRQRVERLRVIHEFFARHLGS